MWILRIRIGNTVSNIIAFNMTVVRGPFLLEQRESISSMKMVLGA